MDDHALVRAVLAGEREAFRQLVEREQVIVYRACLRILGRPDEAEDVAQEAFLMAYRSLGGWRGEGPLGAWVTRIATRLAFRRLARRREMLPIDAAAPRPADDARTLDPVLVTLAGERHRAVRLAVVALPDPYREVVALRYFGELSLDEIATATRRPLNTVKTHLRRGLERLRAAIGSEVA